jgi:hypothetical protein
MLNSISKGRYPQHKLNSFFSFRLNWVLLIDMSAISSKIIEHHFFIGKNIITIYRTVREILLSIFYFQQYF